MNFTDLPLEILISITSFLGLPDIVSLLKASLIDKICCLVTDHHGQPTKFKSIEHRVQIWDFNPDVYFPIFVFELYGFHSLNGDWFKKTFQNKRKIMILNGSTTIGNSFKISSIVQDILRTFKSKDTYFLLDGFEEFSIKENTLTPDSLTAENIKYLTIENSSNRLDTDLIYSLKNIEIMKLYVNVIGFTFQEFDFTNHPPSSLLIYAGTEYNNASSNDSSCPIVSLKDRVWNLTKLKIITQSKLELINLEFPNLKKLELGFSDTSRKSILQNFRAEKVEDFKLKYFGQTLFPVLNNTVKIGNKSNFCSVFISHTVWLSQKTERFYNGSFYESDYEFDLFKASTHLELHDIRFSFVSCDLNPDLFSNISDLTISSSFEEVSTAAAQLSDLELPSLRSLSMIFSSPRREQLILNLLHAPNLKKLKISSHFEEIFGIERPVMILVDISKMNLLNLETLEVRYISMIFNDLSLPSLRSLTIENVSDSNMLSLNNKLTLGLNLQSLRNFDLKMADGGTVSLTPELYYLLSTLQTTVSYDIVMKG